MNAPCAISVRPARVAEAADMAILSRDLIEAGLAWRYTPRRIAALIADPGCIVLVACESEAVVQGFAVMHFGDEQAHLTLLCVRPARQRRGIARRLLDWLTASARVAGIARVDLELRADNEGALAFYRRLGFVQVQLVEGYYAARIAARRMSLRLSAERCDDA